MIYIQHKNRGLRLLMLSVVLFFGTRNLSAQFITGPSQVNEEDVVRYYYFNPGHPPFGWECNNCELLLRESNGYLPYMDVRWPTPGAHSISMNIEEGDEGSTYFDVEVLPIEAPTPIAPKVQSNSMGVVTLVWNATAPPSKVNWYWQSTSDGTSTSNSSNTISLTSGTVYYLRSRNKITGTWSTNSSSVNYTIAPPPIWYYDSDGDGFGNSSPTIASYVQPLGYVNNDLDACPDVSGPYDGCLTNNNENYVRTTNYQKPYSESDLANTIPAADKMETVAYFDGIGRPKQNIGIRGGGNGEDVVTHVSYDDFGRKEKEYLPYAMNNNSNNGLYRVDALVATNAFYKTLKYENTINPYSEKEFEPSPLNRVMKQAAPGEDWKKGNGHEVKLDYQTNTVSEVKQFIVESSDRMSDLGLYLPTIVQTTNYDAGQLYKTITKDENWVSGLDRTVEEYKDKEGQVVLKRTYDNQVAHDTYYVYDQYGNLSYVLPPSANGAVDAVTLTNLCYQYRYDSRNRLVEKKLPGKGWEYIVYDKLDHPILTQDANLRAQNKWLFTKYDAFGRVVYTGEYANTSDRATVQSQANAIVAQFEAKQGANTINGTTAYYSNTAFPTAGIDLFTINYYDDYGFDVPVDAPSGAPIYGVTPITNAKGLATGSKIRVLGTSSWTTNVIYYDVKGRPVYNYSRNNFLNITSTVKNDLDFVGKVKEATSTHKKGTAADVTIVDSYSYDHTGRLLTQNQSVNGQTPEVIVSNSYDELGQLVSKGVGGKTYQNRLQTIDYTYNVRGWLKGINDVNAIGNDLFSFKLSYNDSTAPQPLYNGNISQSFWKTANQDTSLKNYDFTYDDLNRLTNAVDNQNRYSEALSYDLNGNIKTLKRNGNQIPGTGYYGPIDDLTYDYVLGNQLNRVSDATGNSEGFKDVGSSTDYGYDANGNMTSDTNKGITSITYNQLNLPVAIQMGGGTITYDYDATGTKLRKTVNGNTTDYAGGFQYFNGTLQFFAQPEGYVDWNNGNIDYIYQYKDHLGNVRLAYKDGDKDGTVDSRDILSEDNYYPFGLKQKGYNGAVVNTNNKYKYNGKELQDELGLNTYDYGARFYDPATGRWFTVDAMAEKYSELSPYNYALNNPVIYVDPDGNEVEMCCEGLKGFLVGLADNVAGTNLRSNYGGSDFNDGAKLADVVSVIGGSYLTGQGLAHTTAGAGGLSDSVAVTAGSGGLAIEVTAPAAALSAAVMGVGALETMVGGNITMNAMSNLKSSGKETGSYTNTHESGKKYHGKGDEKRMNESGKRVANEHNDPVKSQDYTPAKNDREAFKQEARRMQTDKGGHKSPNNYNKRDSPGTKYIEQDKVKK